MGIAEYAVDNPATLAETGAAAELWPQFTGTDNGLLRQKYAAALADLIGAPGEFHRYLAGPQGDLAERQDRLIAMFRDNVRLLLGKTWVESHDEKRRDSAIALLDKLLSAYRSGDWPLALGRFATLAADLAWLLFGESPDDPLFMDYVYRIDSKLGLFYWFVSRMKDQPEPKAELAKLQLLVGMYALASF